MEKRTWAGYKEGLGIVGQIGFYLFISMCALFTFSCFGLMALNGGELTMNSMIFGEMWYEIALLGVLAGVSSAHLWFRAEKDKRLILALLIVAGFLMGASVYLALWGMYA